MTFCRWAASGPTTPHVMAGFNPAIQGYSRRQSSLGSWMAASRAAMTCSGKRRAREHGLEGGSRVAMTAGKRSGHPNNVMAGFNPAIQGDGHQQVSLGSLDGRLEGGP